MVRRIGVHIDREIECHQLFPRVVSEQFEHRRIRIQHALIAFGAIHTVHRASHQGVVVRTRARQHLLRQPALAHVARDCDVTRHFRIGIADDRDARLDPDRGTVGTTQQPGGDRETLAGRHLVEQHHRDRTFLRRHQRREMLADEAGERKSEQLLEIARGVGDRAVSIDRRHRRFKRLGEQSRQVASRRTDGVECRGSPAGGARVHQNTRPVDMRRNLHFHPVIATHARMDLRLTRASTNYCARTSAISIAERSSRSPALTAPE